MNAMRWLAAVVVVAGLGAARADDKADLPKKLVGKWEIVKADEGTAPVKATVEFTKDGKLKVNHPEAGAEAVEATYKVEKDTFTMTMKRNGEERTKKLTIKKITDSELIVNDEDGKSVELKKVK